MHWRYCSLAQNHWIDFAQSLLVAFGWCDLLISSRHSILVIQGYVDPATAEFTWLARALKWKILLDTVSIQRPCFKMKDSHYKDNMVLRHSYPYNGNSYTGKREFYNVLHIHGVILWWYPTISRYLGLILYLKPFGCWSQNISGELGQYHGCWCPGSLCHQAISSHYIDCTE